MKNNYVAKNAHKANKAKVFLDRKKKSKIGKKPKHKNSQSNWTDLCFFSYCS